MKPSPKRRNAPVFFALLLFAVAPFPGGCARSGAVASRPDAPPAQAGTPPPTSEDAVFFDRTAGSGIAYQWAIAGPRPANILELIGNGCAFLDYNRDGNLDILLVGPKCALYQGDGTGKFTDVSDATGISGVSGKNLSCAVGDVNNDGFPDLYIGAYRGGALLMNRGGRTFENATPNSGLAAQPWATAVTLFDADGDGKLDLYVGNYVRFDAKTEPQLCTSGGVTSACGPRHYDPEGGKLYLGDGTGRFRDATGAAGLAYLNKSAEAMETAEKLSGKCLGVATADFDGSGRVGIALANDEMPGDLLQSVGKGRYKNTGQLSGTAYDKDGGMHGGMGTDWGDVDGDGMPDLFVATFQNEPKCLYLNAGGGVFEERSGAWGLAPSRPYVAFGCKFLDFDNDGWLDLIIANGHVQDNISKVDSSATYQQPTILFRNRAGKGFEDASVTGMDAPARRAVVGRGLAVGDYDNDGKMDALVVDAEGTPLLLHNESRSAGRWLGFALSQEGGGNRDAFGAVVTVTIAGRKIVRHCRADGSYMSASDSRVHVGLGSASQAERVTVRWPGGKLENFGPLPAGKYHRLERGKGLP